MRLNNDFISQIRKSEMEIHFLSVSIWQDKEEGLKLKGYGTIKQNKFGTLFLEFVCTDTQYEHKANGETLLRFPSDSLKLEDQLFAELLDISGRKWQTQGFKLELSVFELNRNKVIYIPLSFIESEEVQAKSVDKSYLHFEFAQDIDIPFNKSNSKTSTATGSESFGFNELSFETNNIAIRILNASEYRFAKVVGDFEPESIEQCLKFYLGFSCGVLVQPYILFTNVGNINKCVIRSFNNQTSHKRSTNPIPSNVHSPTGKGSYSVELFERVLALHTDRISYFNCLSSQWERVWRAFNTTDNIAELVLSVAIEGIINDVYIPDFKLSRVDQDLVNVINEIKSKLNALEVEPVHLERLKTSVSYWKNITAAKALDILISETVLASNDKKIWNKVRNASAHPTSKQVNNVEEQQKRDEFYTCLDIFHKLVLNVLAYSGPLTLFSTEDRKTVFWKYQQVLNSTG